MNMERLEQLVSEIALAYPPPLDKRELADIPRIGFHLSILRAHIPPGGRVVDIGGGIGMMSLGAAAIGYEAILVDDFKDKVNEEHTIESLGLHRRHGVKVLSINPLKASLDFEPNSLDAVTSFDSMEHWHSSPKAMFHKLVEALQPGGLFFLGVPNCVNLRKRLTVPLGIGKWSLMEDWYEAPVFRGHVREPDVEDLHYIARDLQLQDVRVFGRNWAGYASRFRWVRALTPYFDRLLRLYPSLCSDIYLIGKKPVGIGSSRTV